MGDKFLITASVTAFFKINFQVGELDEDEGDGSDSENSAAITDSEDEDECYQESEKEDIIADLRVGWGTKFVK